MVPLHDLAVDAITRVCPLLPFSLFTGEELLLAPLNGLKSLGAVFDAAADALHPSLFAEFPHGKVGLRCLPLDP